MAKTNPADIKQARVIVEIDGEDCELVPTPGAIISLSAKYDGLAPLSAAVARGNVQAAIDIVNAGLSLEGRAAREMAESVASTSLLEITSKLSEFVGILLNGGKPLKEERTQKAADPS